MYIIIKINDYIICTKMIDPRPLQSATHPSPARRPTSWKQKAPTEKKPTQGTKAPHKEKSPHHTGERRETHHRRHTGQASEARKEQGRPRSAAEARQAGRGMLIRMLIGGSEARPGGGGVPPRRGPVGEYG